MCLLAESQLRPSNSWETPSAVASCESPPPRAAHPPNTASTKGHRTPALPFTPPLSPFRIRIRHRGLRPGAQRRHPQREPRGTRPPGVPSAGHHAPRGRRPARARARRAQERAWDDGALAVSRHAPHTTWQRSHFGRSESRRTVRGSTTLPASTTLRERNRQARPRPP